MPNIALNRFATELCRDMLSGAVLDQGYQSGVFVAVGTHTGLQACFLDALEKRLLGSGAKVMRLRAHEFSGRDVLERVTAAAAIQTRVGGRAGQSSDLNDLILQTTSSGTALVMLIENVYAWADSPEGIRMLRALKACRDATNLALGSRAKLLIVGTGSSTKLADLTRDRAQAFYGAIYLTLPEPENPSA
ncbi:hypothetical protein [Duganella violaceipulchra]|uniref:Uncharacterized protein n=1 Tax=Duganella violaceipulchra TaxID=2849652 RepID=A0AA41H962_9BURK|nr:hypothetical protein [Duganella violaceicalia]MBV6324378.1 hypothetical protein [Duganella violaceicalia]MCP2007227.1 hypothetical protein [Duganella violaceicalia]